MALEPKPSPAENIFTAEAAAAIDRAAAAAGGPQEYLRQLEFNYWATQAGRLVVAKSIMLGNAVHRPSEPFLDGELVAVEVLRRHDPVDYETYFNNLINATEPSWQIKPSNHPVYLQLARTETALMLKIARNNQATIRNFLPLISRWKPGLPERDPNNFLEAGLAYMAGLIGYEKDIRTAIDRFLD